MSGAIVSAAVLTHCNDLGGRLWNPAIRWTRKHAVFVELTDDAGRRGLGECWCFDSAPDALVAFLRTEVLPHVVATAPDDIAALADRLRDRATLTARHGILASALSGVDIAAWDLRAQVANLPLYRRIAPDAADRVALYASGGLYGVDKGPEDLAREMAGLARQGFTLVKMKIGGLTPEADLHRVARVLDALPAGTRLIADGVYGYDADAALRIFDALPRDRIEAFQSPVPPEDLAGIARLSAAGVPVMMTEAEYRPELHAALVHEGRVAFLQIAPVACGGISGVLALGDLVAGTGTRLSLEVSSTAVALMAACHVAAACPAVAHVERHTVHTVFFDRLPAGAATMTLPVTPGLGLALPDGACDEALRLGGALPVLPERRTGNVTTGETP